MYRGYYFTVQPLNMQQMLADKLEVKFLVDEATGWILPFDNVSIKFPIQKYLKTMQVIHRKALP